jgi:hypothetical protein
MKFKLLNFRCLMLLITKHYVFNGKIVLLWEPFFKIRRDSSPFGDLAGF